jgi:DNA (cytosine-5)-methyltransferase 1
MYGNIIDYCVGEQLNMLRVGTDCSGIEAPIVALKNLGIKIDHVFSSEIDVNCRKMIWKNFPPKILYEDMTKRNVNTLPNVDIYVCGFPCQPFSTLRSINLTDKGKVDTRKEMVKFCYQVIDTKKPLVFVLENVPTLVSADKGKRFGVILKRLMSSGHYTVHYSTLNTKDFGIPQNRQRLYIVGILKDHMKTPFAFPKPIPLRTTVEDYLIDRTKYTFTPNKYSRRLQARMPKDHARNLYCVKWRGGDGTSQNYSPCITTSTDIFITKYNRNLTPFEKFRLQGFPDWMDIVVPPTVLSKQVGNAMSVNVLEHLFVQVFKSLGLVFDR